MRSIYHTIRKPHFFLLIALTALSVLISCGNKDAPPENVYVVQSTQTACADELKDILDRDISSALTCVRDALETYTTSVKREKPDYIQRSELTRFIKRFFPQNFELAHDLLKLVFELNTLLFNEPADHLSITSYSRLFQLVSIVNLEGLQVKRLLDNLDGQNYWQRRQSLYQRIQILSTSLSAMITPFARTDRRLDLMDFMSNIKSILDLNDDQMNLDSIATYLFAKKLILGGERRVLTITQMDDLLQRAANLVILGLDAFYSQDKEFGNDEEQYFFYFDVVKEAHSHLWQHEEQEEIFTHGDLAYILKDFFAEEHDVDLLEKSARIIKEKFISDSPEIYSFSDILKLLDWAQDFAGMLYYNEVTFKHYKKQLSSTESITSLKKPQLPEYTQLGAKHLPHYWQQFSTITYDYRYYANKEGNSIYDLTYQRTPQGLNRIAMFKWAIEKVFAVYGVSSDHSPDLVASREELHQVMQDGEGVLKAFIYWPNDYEGFLGETINNSDLFQYQSNGDKLANAKEITEYLVSVFHSFDIADRIKAVMKKPCPFVSVEDESFAVECYRRNFLTTFFNKLPLKNYYPRLYKYYKSVEASELNTYFKNIELFARLNPQDDIPITAEELTRIVVIISSIEAIYIKYDANGNNILEREELDQAFLLFRDLIKNFIDLGNDDSKLYKSIFLYLIKHMKEPNAIQLGWFHVFGSKDDITSTRFNVAAIINSIL